MRNKVFEVNETWEKLPHYVQSPFRYPGGKYYALKYIVPFLNAIPHDEYREPFAGGGSVYFGKPKADLNWLNDLEVDLIAVYKAIKSPKRCALLIDRVVKETATRERHCIIRSMEARTPDDLAFKTYYLNRTSYSGIINKPAWGYAIGQSSPPENWGRFLSGASIKLKNVKLTSVDFEKVLSTPALGSSLLTYLDPPYFLADQKRAYTKSFVLNDHLRLEGSLRVLSTPFVLSYDDCDEVRDLYHWANIHSRNWFHNTANSSGPRKVGQELIITNFKTKHLD